MSLLIALWCLLMQGRSVTSRNGGLNFTTLRDTPTSIGFYLTDTVEADADWKKVVYILYTALFCTRIYSTQFL